MKKNVSKPDLIIRLIFGIILLAVSFTITSEDSTISMILWCLSGILIVSSIVRFCPIYFFLDLDTNKSKRTKMY